MNNLLEKGYEPNEIFQQTHWFNSKGGKAIDAKKNRDLAEAIMLFGQTYFPEHFPSKHPKLHTDMLALMVSDNRFKAIAVPRGHSKSTLISFLLALYRIVFMERKFIVIVSESEDKAKDFVIRIKSELEFNTRLIEDFGNGNFKTADWSKTDFTTSTGIRVIAKGAGQSLRGLIHRDTRPDCVILDDIETNETAGTTAVLNFILTDVFKAVNKRGLYDICYVGTIIKDMSILHQMAINSEFCSSKWEAIDDEGNMIAPMLLPKNEYDREKRLAIGLGKMSTFYAEYHNNPMVADSDQTFKQEYFQYYGDLPDNMNYYIAYDPAMPDRVGSRGKADRSAIIVLGTDSRENWYVLKIVANRDTPSKNRELLFNLVKKYKKGDIYPTVWMETISAQRSMYLEIRNEMVKKNILFPFREIPSHSNSKEARIEQLQPMYESGRIYHNKDDVNTVELERELLLFGRTPHDDCSDCLSFFLGKVKYPSARILAKAKEWDRWDKKLSKETGSSWRIL